MGSGWRKMRKGLRREQKSKRVPFSEEQLRKVFMAHDKNGDGQLDKEELKNAFQTLGSRAPGYRADRALHYADIDIDGAINYDEIDHLVSYAIQYGYTCN